MGPDRLRTEGGFTIVEALIAAVLLVIAAAALMTALAGARKATYRGEQYQVASDIAQREIEALRAVPFDELALTAAPTNSSDPEDPRAPVEVVVSADRLSRVLDEGDAPLAAQGQ